jgi:hypothetical protein
MSIHRILIYALVAILLRLSRFFYKPQSGQPCGSVDPGHWDRQEVPNTTARNPVSTVYRTRPALRPTRESERRDLIHESIATNVPGASSREVTLQMRRSITPKLLTSRTFAPRCWRMLLRRHALARTSFATPEGTCPVESRPFRNRFLQTHAHAAHESCRCA